MGRLIRASVPKRNWEWVAGPGVLEGGAKGMKKREESKREGEGSAGEGIARSGYVLQRILKYFNCSGSRGTLEGFIRNHSIESMNRD